MIDIYINKYFVLYINLKKNIYKVLKFFYWNYNYNFVNLMFFIIWIKIIKIEVYNNGF